MYFAFSLFLSAFELVSPFGISIILSPFGFNSFFFFGGGNWNFATILHNFLMQSNPQNGEGVAGAGGKSECIQLKLKGARRAKKGRRLRRDTRKDDVDALPRGNVAAVVWQSQLNLVFTYHILCGCSSFYFFFFLFCVRMSLSCPRAFAYVQ